MEHLSQQEWVAIASHRLAHRWRHVDPQQLDEVAAELYGDASRAGGTGFSGALAGMHALVAPT